MRKLLNKIRHEECGASTILVVITLTALLVFTAFAVDYGIAYFNTSKLQNAADSATLAATKLLPVDVTDESAIALVKETAVDYANKNGNYPISVDNIVLGDPLYGRYTSVRVSIPCQISTTFAKIIGVNTFSFERRAKAIIAPSLAANDCVPLGVDYLELKQAIDSGKTEHIYLKYGGGGGTIGSYGAIDLDGVKGGGAKDFESWLMYGYSGTIYAGETLLPVEKGNMAGPTEDAIALRYSQCTHFTGSGGCTAEHFDPDCPRVITVLVIQKVGTQYVRVMGFAEFVIEGITKDEVLGSYVKACESGNANENVNWATSEYGLYNISLTE